MTSVLVTGGAGAIGGNMVAELLRRGHRVVVLDNLSSGFRENVPPEAEFIEGSVASDDAVRAAFASRPDYVVHLAALFANQNSVDHPEDDLTTNGLGTLKVLEQARRASVRKVVYFSSSCVYGDHETMVETECDLRPETPYAVTKLLGEHYCRILGDLHGLNTCTIRPFNVYGPGDPAGKYRSVIPNFFAQALARQALVITGTGDETRDFTYVGDCVDGALAALFGDTTPGLVLNIGSGSETRISDLARAINELAGNSTPIEFKPRRNWDGVTRRRGVVDKARDLVGYTPRMRLHDGLRITYDWIKSRSR